MAPFAERHRMYAVFHQHRQPAEPGFSFDKFLAYSPAIMLNFDVGHDTGCMGSHPNPVIERLHDRILSLHLKDFTGPKSTPPDTNRFWGKGETPLADVLKLVQKQKGPIYRDIELEYEVPAGFVPLEFLLPNAMRLMPMKSCEGRTAIGQTDHGDALHLCHRPLP